MKLQHIYFLLSICLLVNNILGVVLNFELVIWGIIFLIAVPRLIFLFVYGLWYYYQTTGEEEFRYNPSLLFLMIFYNIVIYYLSSEVKSYFNSFYPDFFPLLNIILCGLMFTIRITEKTFYRKTQ